MTQKRAVNFWWTVSIIILLPNFVFSIICNTNRPIYFRHSGWKKHRKMVTHGKKEAHQSRKREIEVTFLVSKHISPDTYGLYTWSIYVEQLLYSQWEFHWSPYFLVFISSRFPLVATAMIFTLFVFVLNETCSRCFLSSAVNFEYYCVINRLQLQAHKDRKTIMDHHVLPQWTGWSKAKV